MTVFDCKSCNATILASPYTREAKHGLCPSCLPDENVMTYAQIVHELRNAVGPAMAALKMLREEDTSAERREKLLDRVELGLSRVERLANDLAEKERS